jgi:cytochrome c oxidase subunit IV
MPRLHIDKPGDYPLAHQVIPVRVYLAVFSALLVLTALTVWVAFQHLGDPWNDVVAIIIAVTKATLVVLFFMHVKYSTAMVRLTVIAAILFLLTLFGITWSDYWARKVPGIRVQQTTYGVRE